MKILTIADLHLSKSVYGVMDKKFPKLPFRTVDFMRSFQWIIDKCLSEIKPDLVIMNGDIYDYHNNMSNIVRGFFSKQLSRLMENKIPCIILVGNHDISMSSHALNDIQELNLKAIKIIDQPLILEFKGHRLCLFPYSLDIEQKKLTLQQAFNKFSLEIQDLPKDKPILFFGHFGINGAVLNDFKKDENLDEIEDENLDETSRKEVKEKRIDYINNSKEDIRASQLDEMGVDYILMGDFHKHQRIKTKTIGYYCGSIERTGFTEMNHVKGFMVYDSDASVDKEYGKCRFVEYPNCRPMLEIVGNLDTIKKQFSACDYSRYQGAIVRLVFKGDSNDLLYFSSGIEEFKKEIFQKLNPVHVFTNQKPPTDKIQEQKATELEKEIMERGHFTDKDIIGVLNEMVVERVKDDKEQTGIMELADSIYKEVKAEE